MRVAVLSVVVVAALAGCALPGRPPVTDTAGDGASLRFDVAVPVSTDYPGAEPVIAVAADGTVYVEGIGRLGNGNVNKVSRSNDGGATWTDVTPPAMGQERSNDGYLAVAEDGTVYASNVFSLTLQLYRSTDKGATWTRLPVPPVPTAMHRHWYEEVGGTLHLTVEALPPAFAPFLGGIPPPTSTLGTPNEGMWYARSTDQGDTWTTPVQIDKVVNFAGQSQMVVSEDGTRVYVGRYEEDADPTAYTYDDGRWYLLASEDGGDTWERREMFPLTSEMSTAVPSLALFDDGSLAMAWTQEDGGVSRLRYAWSEDARTWSAPVAPDVGEGTHAMAWALPRANGTLGLMWYTAPADGTASKVDATWAVDYSDIHDPTAATGAPRAEVVRVAEAVHEGNICARGPACGEGEDRSLLDYPWMDGGPDGRAWIVFPSTAWDRPSAFAVVASEAR